MKETEQQFKDFGYGYEGRDVKFPNGYDEVLPTLSGDYQVKFSTKSNKINYDNGGVQISDSSGTTDFFDAVIVTVPIGVLKK